MEEIVQILIFVGAMVIAVIGQNAKNKKKPTAASPQEVLEDMFPEINIQEEEKPVAPSQQSVRVRKKTSARPLSISPVESNVPKTDSPDKKKKISLTRKEEARRAFIYSEIFNRKY